MSKLIKRLRAQAETERWYSYETENIQDVLEEAATEIDRLEKLHLSAIELAGDEHERAEKALLEVERLNQELVNSTIMFEDD